MNDLILSVMALGALLGGMDHMLGNRFGLGQAFEKAFLLLGSIGLSMAGILCLSPVLSDVVRTIFAPLYALFGFDPGIMGGILPIDMGGYQMALNLAEDTALGLFAGILLSSTFGCTVIFTLPVGMGAMDEMDRPYFIRGLLIGLSVMPLSLLAGGMVMGLSPLALAMNCIPIFLISILLIIGLRRAPEAMAQHFRRFSGLIQKVAILGLTFGAVQHMTGWHFPGNIVPLADAMEVVCSIAIVMLGSMPLAVLFQKLLHKPLLWIHEKTRLNEASTTGMLLGAVSVVPALAMFPQMDRRGKIMNGAFLVCSASTFAAHLGFTITVAPEMTVPLLICKLLGGLLGAAAALVATHNESV